MRRRGSSPKIESELANLKERSGRLKVSGKMRKRPSTLNILASKLEQANPEEEQAQRVRPEPGGTHQVRENPRASGENRRGPQQSKRTPTTAFQ